MSNIKVGVSRICITPPLGTPLSGYFEPRYTSGVHDELYATAVAFDDGKNKAVIITLDLCGLKNQWWLDDCKKLISQYCNIPIEAIILTCSHTHTGPIVGPDIKDSGADSNKAYDNFLMLCIRDAAYGALADVKVSKFFVAENTVKDLAFCRIFRMKDGKVQTNPGVGNPDILHPLAEPNDQMTLIKIVREDAEDIMLVNFGVHADCISNDVISADWPGVMRDTIESVYPDTFCVFLQGCEGDLNTTNVKGMIHGKGYARAASNGHRIAGAVIQVCDDAKGIELENIAFANKTIFVPTNQENHRLDEARRIIELHTTGRDDEIPFEGMELTTAVAEAIRIINLENGPEEYKFNLSAIKLGDIAIVGLPGEPFSEIGKRIIENSPFEKTLVCVLTDGGEIYFPTSYVIGEGGYEARSSVVKKGADDIIVSGAIELLNKIK